MNVEKTNSSLSGHSLVALIMPNQQTVNDGDSSYATTEIQYIQEQIPDLRFIYYGGGSIQRFSSFVRDPSQDLFSLILGSTAATSAGPVAKRIIQSKGCLLLALNICLFTFFLQFLDALLTHAVDRIGTQIAGALIKQPNMWGPARSTFTESLPTISLELVRTGI